MDAGQYAAQQGEQHAERRVVEAEIRLPKLEELHFPQVDLEPMRKAAEEVLLTSLGVGVLVVRGVLMAVRAAHQAGIEEAENPGPIAKALLGLVHKGEPGPKGSTATTPIAQKVPVLPLDNYDRLNTAEILERLSSLSAEQAALVRDYESAHQARPDIVAAAERQISGPSFESNV